MTRILIADDHEVLRRGLRSLIEAERADWRVCGEAATGREAVDMALELRPDVAVLDLKMPDLSGLEATRQIRRYLPAAEILIYTMHEADQLVRNRRVVSLWIASLDQSWGEFSRLRDPFDFRATLRCRIPTFSHSRSVMTGSEISSPPLVATELATPRSRPTGAPTGASG